MKSSLKNIVARATGMSALTALGAVLMGAAAPASCIFPDPEPPPPVSDCVSDGDCRAGQHCSTSDGDCLPSPGCPPGALCPAVCGGVCVDDAPACTSDADCRMDQICELGVCPLAPCIEREDGTWDCPVCEGTCVPRPTDDCVTDDDCGRGFVCQIEVCAECAPGDPAAEGGADPSRPVCGGCWGSCVPAPDPAPCDTFGTECAMGEECVYDECTICPDDAVCFVADGCWGHCESVPPPPPEGCRTDEDCGDGLCVFFDCPYAADAMCPAGVDGGCGPCAGTCVYEL
jgi:hypothetical protein